MKSKAAKAWTLINRVPVWRYKDDVWSCLHCFGRSHRPWCWYAQLYNLLSPVARKRKPRKKA